MKGDQASTTRGGFLLGGAKPSREWRACLSPGSSPPDADGLALAEP